MSTLDASIAKRMDITVKQNQTFNISITVLDNASQPIDLTGVQVKMSVRQDGCAGSCAYVGDSDFNQIFKQDFVPTINVNVLQFFETVLLAEGTYKYDILLEYGSGLKQYILKGSFKVKRSFTSI